MVYCRSLFTVLLSACLLISQASPVYAQTAPVAHEADSVQSIAEETVQVYRSLTDNSVQNSFCSGITLPEEVNPYQFESFCTQWMSQVNAICQKTLKNPDNITELLDPSEGNVAEQCAELQKPEILLEMYQQQEDVLGESTEAQRVYLENLSGTVLAYLKQDEEAMLNALKEASPIEQLDPYTLFFRCFI